MATVALLAVGTAITLFSGFKQASAMEKQGKQQQQIANMQAEQTRKVAERNALIIRDQAKFTAGAQTEKAKAEQASAQRAFLEQRRQTRLAQSRAKAAAGASGGGVGDPTALDIYGGLAQEGDFAAQTALFEGDSAASLLTSQAALTLYEGEQRAGMTEFGGAQQSDLLQFEGASAKYAADAKASSTRMKAVGDAASSVASSSLMSKYAPATATTGGKYGYGRTGNIDWTSGRY
jgi:hypothetical protein